MIVDLRPESAFLFFKESIDLILNMATGYRNSRNFWNVPPAKLLLADDAIAAACAEEK